MKRIGLTGGIGSGKTVVATLLRMMGWPVYDSDERTKTLYDSDETLKTGLIALFGREIYPSGSLDRKALSAFIFNHPDALERVQALVHPVVEADFRQWAAGQSTPAVFQESAILFETGLNTLCDVVVVVTAPESLRLSRVCARNGSSPEGVRARMALQLPESDRALRADVVLVNDDLQPLIPQVLKMVETLLD